MAYKQTVLTSVERVLAELLGELHKVTLAVCELFLETSLLGHAARTADLELVVVDTDDLHVRETRDLARRAADTAADVEHAHAGTQVHARGEVVLVAGGGLVEALALVEAAEVEGLAPAELVEAGGSVVVACAP